MLAKSDNLSGLPTRSDLARQRELAKYGLDLSWFDQLVESQQNLCSDCHKPEREKLANGRKRPLGLGFENGQPNRLICTSCASKQRKARMEERKKPIDYSDFQDWWLANREALPQENLAEFSRLRERHEEVTLLYEAVCDYVRGTDACPEGLEDTLDEVEQELRENGTTDLDMLCVPFYRVASRGVFDAIQEAAEISNAPVHARNAFVFAKYGLLQALPTHATENYVRIFLKQNGRYPYPDWGKAPNPIKTVKCSTYGCASEFQYNVNTDTAPPAQWFCPACRARNTRSDRPRPTLAERAPDNIYTIGGKWKTATEPFPPGLLK